jgi:hypothetical protein
MSAIPEINLIPIQFSDGIQSHTYGELISQSRNRDLWCLTFKTWERALTSIGWQQTMQIWTHVYRQHATCTYMYDLVFKIELTKEYNKAGTKFNMVRVCTTDNPQQYHIITAEEYMNAKQFMACGYLVTMGDDGLVTTEKFKKFTPPIPDKYAKFTTLGHHIYLYYPPTYTEPEHVIYRGEIATRNRHGNLLSGRDRTATFQITHRIQNPHDGFPFTSGSIYSKGNNLFLHSYSNTRNKFDQHHKLDILHDGESTVLNTYTRDTEVEVGCYPEWVTWDSVDCGYLVLDYDYSFDGICIGHGTDASSQYSNSFYEAHPPNYMRWTNRRLTYRAPDGLVREVRILDAFFDMDIENMAMLSASIVSIEYSYQIPHWLSALLTCYYHFDRTQMTLVPISITLVDFCNWKPSAYTMSNDNQMVIINRDQAPLAILGPQPDPTEHSGLADILPPELVDIVHFYCKQPVPYVMTHELTDILHG